MTFLKPLSHTTLQIIMGDSQIQIIKVMSRDTLCFVILLFLSPKLDKFWVPVLRVLYIRIYQLIIETFYFFLIRHTLFSLRAQWLCSGEESSHTYFYMILGEASIVCDWQWCKMWDFHIYIPSHGKKVHVSSVHPLLLRWSWICTAFILLLWCTAITAFLNGESPLLSWDKSHLVIVYNHFFIWLNLVVSICLNIF